MKCMICIQLETGSLVSGLSECGRERETDRRKESNTFPKRVGSSFSLW